MRSQLDENVTKQLEDFYVQQRHEKEELMTELSNLIDAKMNAGTSPATAWSQTQVQQNCVDFRTIMKETIVEQVKERADLENRETNLSSTTLKKAKRPTLKNERRKMLLFLESCVKLFKYSPMCRRRPFVSVRSKLVKTSPNHHPAHSR